MLVGQIFFYVFWWQTSAAHTNVAYFQWTHNTLPFSIDFRDASSHILPPISPCLGACCQYTAKFFFPRMLPFLKKKKRQQLCEVLPLGEFLRRYHFLCSKCIISVLCWGRAKALPSKNTTLARIYVIYQWAVIHWCSQVVRNSLWVDKGFVGSYSLSDKIFITLLAKAVFFKT